MTTATRERVQHVYDFSKLDKVPVGPTSAKVAAKRLLSGPTLATGKSSTVGAALFGEHIIFALGGQVRGTGARAHTHANEQIDYILQGVSMGDIEGDRVFAPKGTIKHVPGSAVHTGLSCPDEDLFFLAMKDKRGGIVGPPVDGVYNGPNYLPGFGTRANESLLTTAQLIEEAARTKRPNAKRYVYEVTPGSAAPAGSCSAVVTPGPQLGLPKGFDGTLVTGEMLHVGVLVVARGASTAPRPHANEQFVFVVEGELEAELEGETMQVPQGSALHVPTGLRHSLATSAGGKALIVVVQDQRAAFAL